MNAWNVFLNGEHIDTVWYDSDMGYEQVTRSLVDHDGYNPRIVVVRSR